MGSFRGLGRKIGPPPPPSGELLAGRYRVESLIGEGGMGTVLCARHELLDLPVAVKLLSPKLVNDRPMVERFLREARAAARLKSDHVARVTDVGTLDSGQPYIVMELLQGEDLEERRERLRQVPIPDAVDFVLQALEAMAHAHAAGIVHRDLKPANLFLALLPDGRQVIKVLDFGIAKLTDPGKREGHTPSLTGEHSLGSPSYMAPEQIRNASKIDTRADIWAIGVILFDLMSGQLPFPGEMVGEIFGNVLVGSVPSLVSLRPDVPPGLEAAVRRCLEREPEKRFADVQELARALAPFGSGAWNGYIDRIGEILARGGASLRQEDTGTRRNPFVRTGGQSSGRFDVSPLGAAQKDRTPGEVRRVSLQETLQANTVEAPPGAVVSGKWKTRVLAAASVAIVVFVAAGVVRSRGAARGEPFVAGMSSVAHDPGPTSDVSGAAVPPASAAAATALEPSAVPAVTASAAPPVATPTATPAPAASDKPRTRRPPGSPATVTVGAPRRPTKRPVLLDSPD